MGLDIAEEDSINFNEFSEAKNIEWNEVTDGTQYDKTTTAIRLVTKDLPEEGDEEWDIMYQDPLDDKLEEIKHVDLEESENEEIVEDIEEIAIQETIWDEFDVINEIVKEVNKQIEVQGILFSKIKCEVVSITWENQSWKCDLEAEVESYYDIVINVIVPVWLYSVWTIFVVTPNQSDDKDVLEIIDMIEQDYGIKSEEDLEDITNGIEYNTVEIIWSGAYNWVTVDVVAPIWSFPEWTILKIIPIDNYDKKKMIEELIGGEIKVSVSFDISFLDPETLEEISPISWSKVDIEFNYDGNEDFLEIENENMAVYHINENIKEQWKIKAEEMPIASNDSWRLKIDANSFSTYTLLWATEQYTITFDAQWWVMNRYSISWGKWTSIITSYIPDKVWYMFDGWYTDSTCTASNPSWCINERWWIINSDLTVHAKWLEFRELSVDLGKKYGGMITVMDRNLWATQPRTNAQGSATQATYGKLYQRWNNHGFDGVINSNSFSSKYTVTNVSIDASNIINWNYYNNEYIFSGVKWVFFVWIHKTSSFFFS